MTFRTSSPSPCLLALPWGLAVLLWLIDAVAAPGRGTPAALDAIVAWTAMVATAVGFGLAVAWLWRRGTPERILLLLLALAGVTYFTGLDQEVVGRYFGDEGIYLAQARRINRDGQLLRPWFIYPHLLFYLDAFALWLASALGPVVPFAARWLYGVEQGAAVQPLVTRGVTALLGATAVVPTFVTARRIAGPLAAGLGGGLIALCPVFVRVAHLNISDVVGAFFAAMTVMQCAFLVGGESDRSYLLAGLWAGLAAGGKYPAGVVAVAVAGVWIGWRIRERNLRPGLLWAALAAIAVFLGTTPSLLAFPGAVYGGTGSSDVLFGFRQYARSGWTGVVRASNLDFYLDRILHAFGFPAVALGLTGILGLDRVRRRRLLWLLPFPVIYLSLMMVMKIAVDRNLLPVLPALAALLGAGSVGWIVLGKRVGRLGGRVSVLGLVAIVLALPVWRAGVTVARFSRPTTREMAAEWIPENLPPGSALVQEVYTPRIQPGHLYPSVQPRFVVRLPPERLRDPAFDFVFLASQAYGRFFRPEALDDRYREPGRERYEEIFETFEPVAEWVPGRFRAGPTLRLYELDPKAPPWSHHLRAEANSLLTATPAMHPEADGSGEPEPEGPVIFRAPGQWALVKGYMEPGHYRVIVHGESTGEGNVQVLTRRGEEIDVALFRDTPRASIRLPRREKYFFYFRLSPGSTLRSVRIEPRPTSGARSGPGDPPSRIGRMANGPGERVRSRRKEARRSGTRRTARRSHG